VGARVRRCPRGPWRPWPLRRGRARGKAGHTR